MRTTAERRVVAHLAAGGLSACQIADIAAVPRSTVCDWLRAPARRTQPIPEASLDVAGLPEAAYSYLLGFYLGDGWLSRARGGVYRLRIATDERYPRIVAECAYPRYFFTQVSDDIRRLFCAACRRVGVEYTWNTWKTVSIARTQSVALLDTFVGPKA